MANYFDRFDDVPTEAPLTGGQNFFDQFDEAPTEAPPEAAQEPGFLERSQDTLADAGTGITDALFGNEDEYADTSNIDPATMETFGAPTESPMQRVSEAGATALGAASNVLVDGGLSLIQSVMPDSWEERVKNFSREAWDKIMTTPARQGVEALEKGYEHYKAWAEENPEWAQTVEEAVSVGSMGRTGPKRGDTYIKRQKKHNISNRKDQTRQLLEPDTKDFTNWDYYEDTGGTVRGSPKTWTKEVLDEVVRVPDVKPKKSYVHNMNAVRTKSKDYKDELDSLVSAKGKQDINIDSVKTGLANRVNSLDKETLLTGDPLAKAIKIYDHATDLLDEADGSALSILNVRRKLDEWVSDQSRVFDADLQSATSIALRDIRGYLNDTVKKNTKSTRVSTLLDKQHKLLTAGDMLQEQASAQADKYFGRLVQKFEKNTGIHLPSTPLAQAATLGAAGVTFGAPGLAGAAGALATYKGVRWLFSPDGKRMLAELARLSDSVPALKPEVIALQQIAQGINPEDPEETGK